MDTRRAILWVVFSISLLMLWDAYMRHTGQGSMFGPQTPTKQPVAGSSTAPAVAPNTGAASLPKDGPPVAAVTSATKAAVPTPTAATAAPVVGGSTASGEKFALKNKELTLEIDSLGGKIVKAVLLNQASDAYEGNRVVLFDQNSQRRYEAQSGLVGSSPQQIAYPNHTTVFKKAPLREGLDPERHLAVVAEAGGVKLTKTYSIDETGFVIRVAHTVQNTGADAVNPMVYLQLMRDGNRPRERASFIRLLLAQRSTRMTASFKRLTSATLRKTKRATSKTQAMAG